MLTLKEIKALEASHDQFVLSSVTPTINPPTWNSFTGSGGNFIITLNEPKRDNGQPYLLQGAGATFGVVTSSQSRPVIFYQIQLASDASFSSDVTEHFLGTSQEAQIRNINVTRFARARARLVNGEWSNWKVAPNSVTSGGLFTFWPTNWTQSASFGFTNLANAVDGDSNTSADKTSDAVDGQLTFDQLSSSGQSWSKLELKIITEISANIDETLKADYSTDNGSSLIPIYNVTTTRSKQTDTIQLSTSQNLGTVLFSFTKIAVGPLNTVTWKIYEVFVEGTP